MIRPLVADLIARWFAVLGGLTAYAMVIVGGFWLVPVACATTGPWILHALMAVGVLLAGASLAAAIAQRRAATAPPRDPDPAVGGPGRVHLGGLVVGSSRLAGLGLVWSALAGQARPPREEEAAPPQRRRDMATIGIALGVLSVIAVLFHWAPVVALGPCS